MQLSDILAFLRKNALYILFFFLPLLSVAMHWRVFQTDLVGVHVWRQVQTQTVIVNFYAEDFNILNPRLDPRGSGDGIERKEFPLMQWLFAGVYKVFGEHVVISRILMFLTGFFSIAGAWYLIFYLFRDRLAAFAGAWALYFSPAFFYYTVNPLPDNFALCWAFWGLAFFFRWYESRRWGHLAAGAFFLAVSTLCKLPFVIFFTAPLLFFGLEWLEKRERGPFVRHTLTTLSFLALPAAWYLWVIPDWKGTDVATGILDNRTPVATLLRYVLDNLVSTLPEMLLNYAAVPLFIGGFYSLYAGPARHDRRFVLLVALSAAAILYFLFEINMIANVHDYYLFPFVPLLFILVGYGALKMFGGRPWQMRLALLCLAVAPLTAFLRTRNSWNPDSPGFNKDWLAYRTELQAAAPRQALCVAGNDVSYQILFYYIDKKGWPFTGDNLTAAKLDAMIQEGAQYLYSDTRQVDENPEIRPMLDSLVLERGTMRVFRLKK